jgi:hypothetical protein
MMQIRYQKPLDIENINLSFTFATICLIGLLFINFSDVLSISALTVTLCNIIIIPILFLMLVFIIINYYDHAKNKKSLRQIISEYNSLSKVHFDEEKFEGFCLDDNELNFYNYKPLREMPKNIAPYFVGEADARR